MKVLIANRILIYQVLGELFKSMSIKPRLMELGVLDGTNAKTMADILMPQEFFLVDSWSTEAFSDYIKNNSHRSWVDDLNQYADYFGGPLSEQATFDRLYQKVVDKFSGQNNVKIIRSGSQKAVPVLRDELRGKPKFDLIYVDASHQYETVLDDLIDYQEFLTPDGFFQLNDCCHSAEGMKQNLGVLEAAVKFCKVANFIPVLLTNTDWTDVLLVKRNSKTIDVIDLIIRNNEISFVEVPDQLLGALQIKQGKRRNISFC